jgi:hypothetical protein
LPALSACSRCSTSGGYLFELPLMETLTSPGSIILDTAA